MKNSSVVSDRNLTLFGGIFSLIYALIFCLGITTGWLCCLTSGLWLILTFICESLTTYHIRLEGNKSIYRYDRIVAYIGLIMSFIGFGISALTWIM